MQRNAAFFLISSMVLGLLDQLHIFRVASDNLLTVVSDTTAMAFNRSVAFRYVTGLQLQHLIHRRLSTEFGRLVFLGFMECQVGYLALFLLFSVIGGFGWFWMGSLHKNIQLMLEFLKGPFLVLHFSCYTLMTPLMMLAVIMLYMLMLLSTLNVIRHLICSNSQNWLLNLNLICETLVWGRKWLADFNTGKNQLVLFDWSNNTGAIDVKMGGSVLEEK